MDSRSVFSRQSSVGSSKMITNRYDTIIDFGKFDNSGVDARMGFSPEALGKYFF